MQLVSHMDWFADESVSCCALMTLCRLEGTYVSTDECDRTLRESRERGTTMYALPSNFNLYTLKDSYMPSGCIAVPVHLAFATVLAYMTEHFDGFAQAWVANDTYQESGDVHNGPFSTKKYMEWLVENKYINVSTSRILGRRQIKVWAFTLRRQPVQRAIRRYTKEYRAYYAHQLREFKFHKDAAPVFSSEWAF